MGESQRVAGAIGEWRLGAATYGDPWHSYSFLLPHQQQQAAAPARGHLSGTIVNNLSGTIVEQQSCEPHCAAPQLTRTLETPSDYKQCLSPKSKLLAFQNFKTTLPNNGDFLKPT